MMSSSFTPGTMTSSVEDDVVTVAGTDEDPLASNELKELLRTLIVSNYVIICGILSVFGIGTNIVNIVVFVRQGFKDSMNISLLGLAVADLLALVSMIWASILHNPLVANSGLPFDAEDLIYMSSGIPHVCFNRIATYITAFITIERCLCITQPLKVKAIITPRRTSIIIITIFVIVFLSLSPLYHLNQFEWRFHLALNRSIVHIRFVDPGEVAESLFFYFQSVAMSALPFTSVIVCTLILIIKLNEKTKWRQSAAAQTKANQEKGSLKDKKIVKMVTFISTIFIICFLPAAAIIFMMAYEPELNFGRQYQDMWFVLWSFAMILETINSSVNVFVYFNMSTKFRVTFIQTFSWCYCFKMADG